MVAFPHAPTPPDDDNERLVTVRNVPADPRFKFAPEAYLNRFALTRAITKGTLRYSDGARVKLPAVKVGTSWAIKPSWLKWYFAELARPAGADAAVNNASRVDQDADVVLRSAGI